MEMFIPLAMMVLLILFAYLFEKYRSLQNQIRNLGKILSQVAQESEVASFKAKQLGKELRKLESSLTDIGMKEIA